MTAKVINTLKAPNTDGMFWYTQAEVVALTGLTQATVSRHMRSLLSKETITRRFTELHGSNVVTQYCIVGLENHGANERRIKVESIKRKMDKLRSLVTDPDLLDEEQLEVIENTIEDLDSFLGLK